MPQYDKYDKEPKTKGGKSLHNWQSVTKDYPISKDIEDRRHEWGSGKESWKAQLKTLAKERDRYEAGVRERAKTGDRKDD